MKKVRMFCQDFYPRAWLGFQMLTGFSFVGVCATWYLDVFPVPLWAWMVAAALVLMGLIEANWLLVRRIMMGKPCTRCYGRSLLKMSTVEISERDERGWYTITVITFRCRRCKYIHHIPSKKIRQAVEHK
jgi:hypothetical protein